jgi:quercetin dioxygenase-like cupin family protein
MSELVEARTTRDKVNAIEALMAQQPQVDLKVGHYFSEGVYARALEIPAGIQLTGKIHKFEQLNILAKGKMKVLVGDFYKEVEAPFIVVSPPGTKRIAIALEDCVWITVHGTHETDLELIEKTFIAQSEQDYLEFKEDRQLVLL